MLNKTNIAWTDRSWNPVRGCTQISAGCNNCYAKARAELVCGCPGFESGFDLRLAPHKLLGPLMTPESLTIFVNSMSDLFHKDIPTDYIADVARIMAATPWHTYQVLTKRHQRMKHLLTGELAWAAALPNVWWGVTVENRHQGLPRIDYLRDVPTNNRFLSVEPLLEALGTIDLSGIGWVIVGGETGGGARPMDIEWARSVRDQTVAAGIPLFYKQQGGSGKKSSKTLDGRTWNEMPAHATAPVASRAERMAMMQVIRDRYGVIGTKSKQINPLTEWNSGEFDL